jgi:translation initiation factor 4B
VSVSGESSKPNPFGAATPADTATREREIEEKRLAQIQEKKDVEEKAKADAREAAKAAKAAEAEKAEKAEASKKIEILQRGEGEDAPKNGETIEKEDAQGEVVDDKAVKPKDIVRDAKPARPSDTGAWRRPSGGPPTPRGDDNIPRGPRGGRGGPRGGGRGRGSYHNDEGRGGRQVSNGGRPSPAAVPSTPSADPEAAVVEDDGWSTVSKPKKNNRGGNAGSRPIAS